MGNLNENGESDCKWGKYDSSDDQAFGRVGESYLIAIWFRANGDLAENRQKEQNQTEIRVNSWLPN